MDGTLYRERHVRSQAQLWNDRDKSATQKRWPKKWSGLRLARTDHSIKLLGHIHL